MDKDSTKASNKSREKIVLSPRSAASKLEQVHKIIRVIVIRLIEITNHFKSKNEYPSRFKILQNNINQFPEDVISILKRFCENENPDKLTSCESSFYNAVVDILKHYDTQNANYLLMEHPGDFIEACLLGRLAYNFFGLLENNLSEKVAEHVSAFKTSSNLVLILNKQYSEHFLDTRLLHK